MNECHLAASGGNVGPQRGSRVLSYMGAKPDAVFGTDVTGARRRSSPNVATMALIVLVAASAAGRFAAALGVLGPWIAPDEMAYAILGRSFWETGDTRLFGLPGGWYGFYPYFAGLPLASFGPATGLIVLKAVQAVLVSLTAVIVYFWTQRLVSQWWALSAAAMSVAMPATRLFGPDHDSRRRSFP